MYFFTDLRWTNSTQYQHTQSTLCFKYQNTICVLHYFMFSVIAILLFFVLIWFSVMSCLLFSDSSQIIDLMYCIWLFSGHKLKYLMLPL